MQSDFHMPRFATQEDVEVSVLCGATLFCPVCKSRGSFVVVPDKFGHICGRLHEGFDDQGQTVDFAQLPQLLIRLQGHVAREKLRLVEYLSGRGIQPAISQQSEYHDAQEQIALCHDRLLLLSRA
jgi:hypothetical protein